MVDEPGGAAGTRGGTEAVAAAVGGVAPAVPRSRLADIADQTVIRAGETETAERAEPVRTAGAGIAVPGLPDGGATANPLADGAVDADDAVDTDGADAEEAARVQARRHQLLAQLGEFRRSQVLVPMGVLPGPEPSAEAPLTVDMGGVRWILAFTGEAALARYAQARGEGDREWRYRGVWGAALLDAAVPTVARSGVPCGVLVDAADGERGLVLPPVVGVVPEDVAVDEAVGGPVDGPVDGETRR